MKHHSFCKEISEYPVYKVKIDGKLYVFAGRDERFWNIWEGKKPLAVRIKNIVEIFGKNAVNKLALKTDGAVFLKETIFHDDIVKVVEAKIAAYAGGGVKKPFISCKHDSSADEFIFNVFRDQQHVSAADFTSAFYEATGKRVKYVGDGEKVEKEKAREAIRAVFKTVYVPISFTFKDGPFIIYGAGADAYAGEGHDNADFTIESFRPLSNILYVRDGNERKGQVALWNKGVLTKLDADLNNVLAFNALEDGAKVTKCITNYLHYRVDKMQNTTLNMFKLFTNTVPNAHTPFMKWISASKTIFKVHSSFIGARNMIGTWSKLESSRFVKSNNEIIVLKMMIPDAPDLYATLLIFATGMYDIKINFKIAHQAIFASRPIPKLLEYIRDEIKIILPTFPMLDPHNDGAYKIIASGMIEDDKQQVTEAQLIKSVEENLAPMFTVMSNTGGVIQLLCKRANRFCNNFNALFYMSQHFSMAKAELVGRVQDIFGVDGEEVYKQWKHIQGANEDARTFFRIKPQHHIVVRVKSNKLSYRFIIDGAETQLQIQRIVHAIRYAIVKGRDITARNKKIVDKIDELDDDDDDKGDGGLFDLDINDFAFDGDADSGADNSFFDDENDGMGDASASASESAGIDDEVAEMKLKGKCPGGPAKMLQGGAPVEKRDWQHKYALNKLYEADKALFTVNTGKQYAKTCQKVSMRQPIVTSKTELEYNKKCFPGAITDTVNYGSTPELAAKNNYWCPKVWCPKSRVGLTMEQFNGKYKGKCPFPGISEEPIIFDTPDYWNGRERYVGYLSPTQHPNQLCMPCCFKKPLSDKTDKCTQVVGSDNYIKTDIFPVEEQRYGMLPESLATFFGNKFCGGKDGGQGMMGDKTDCYVRFGIPLNNQSFLQAIVSTFDNDKIKTVDELVASIVTHVSMDEFLGVHDGLLCRRFLSVVDERKNIHDLRDFNDFKTHFLNKINIEYIKRFNLEALAGIVRDLTEFDMEVKYAKFIVREFRLYNAMAAFKEYMLNPKIKKTHEIFGYLVQLHRPWMNANGYNLIVIEESVEKKKGVFHLSCPVYSNADTTFNKERPTVILVNQDNFYEPVYHVKYNLNPVTKKKGGFSYTKKHGISDNEAIGRLVKLYMGTCNKGLYDPLADKIKEHLGVGVVAQLLNFELHVIAYYLKSNIIVPLKAPAPMDFNHNSGFMFLDTCIKTFKHDIDPAAVKTILTSINKSLGQEYYKVEGVLKGPSRNKVALKVEGCYVYVPLAKYSKIKESDVYREVIRDGAIFISHEKLDKRKDFIDRTQYIELLFTFLWNELIHLIKHRRLEGMIYTMRHPANPIPKTMRRFDLMDQLEKYLPRAVWKSREEAIAKQLSTRVCSTISRKEECVGQCIFVSDSKSKSKYKSLQNKSVKSIGKQSDKKTSVKGGASKKTGDHCKLNVPTTFYNVLMERCIEDLLNPLIALVVRPVGAARVASNDILVYTDADIRKDGLDDILSRVGAFGNFDFEPVQVNIARDYLDVKIDKIVQDVRWITGQTVPLPTFLAIRLKEFSLNVIKGNWLVDLFHHIQNKVYSSAALSRDVIVGDRDSDKDSLELLKHLVKVCKINCILVSRKTPDNPDRFKCVGHHKAVDFYVMINKEKKSTDFQLYSKNKKFLFTHADFPEDFSKVIRQKCSEPAK